MIQKHFTTELLENLDKQYKVHLINSLGGFKSVSLLGTINNSNVTNLAIFSSIFHIGANPPLIALIFRPSPPERNTLSNILNTGFYTINHINESIYKQAHQSSARYDSAISEFDVTGLQAEFKNGFFAPFVMESHVQFAVEFKEKIDITLNNTAMVIGEIKEVYVPVNCISEDGFLDIEKANTITCSGLDSYHKTVRIDRLTYAKPNKEISSLAINCSD
jgi:flavin reductase (DIM6/NTAB) family NADH-FMN oxidoreductase RutF